jgi:hypothetical protein
MAKQISCECGYVIHGDTDDQVLVLAEVHIQSDHPELVGKVTRDDLLSWVEEV